MKSLVFVGLSIFIFLSVPLTSANVEPEIKPFPIPGAPLTSAEDKPAMEPSPIPGAPLTSAEDESEIEPPAFTCVVIGDAACQRMCKMLGRIHAAPPSPAKCDRNNNCECALTQHKYLDDLWRDKFTSVDFLETVKTDEQRYQNIVDVMKLPYKTREQTRSKLESLFDPEDFAKIQVNDNVAEHMVKTDDTTGKETLDRDNIRSFVSQSLQSDPFELPADFCYKCRFREALRNAADDETLQFIVHDVRRSNHPVLNKIADEVLEEKNIKEDSYTEDGDDSFTDILDLYLVTEYLDPWDLPNLDVDSVKALETGRRCWTGTGYKVCQFKASWGDIQLNWIKGKTDVDIDVDDSENIITQKWKLDNGVKISLTKDSKGDLHQTWKFSPDSQFEYTKNGDVVDEKWLNDKKNDEALAKYKAVIDSWCEKNSIFMERQFCVIY